MASKYNPEYHHRRSIRLRGYDYSQAGAYFVTICACQKQYLFGDVVDEQVHLSDYGRIVEEEWVKSPEIRGEIELDEWVIMPNHLHAVVLITTVKQNMDGAELVAHGGAAIVGAHGGAPSLHNSSTPKLQRKPRSLSSFIAGFKASAARRVNVLRGTPGEPLWQDNYYEHIIRNEAELDRIREYIVYNPANWGKDKLNSVNW